MFERLGIRTLVAGLIAVLALLSAGVIAHAQLFDTKAKQAFMIDALTGTVLFEKDGDRPVSPASLVKLMTMETVFQTVKTGRRKLTDVFPVSENAWRTGGAPSGSSTMFAALKSSISLGDLIRGVIVQGANDACIIIAEGFSGTEASFVETMNERAKALGLTGSDFKNSTGLPVDGQTVTMRDMVALASHMWRTYPDFFKIYAEREFTWNKITQRNRNPLLSLDLGVDGMGTGHTDESGYAMVASADKGGMRLFLAVAGLASEKERSEETRKLIEWALGSFVRVSLFAPGESMGLASVFGGQAMSVPVGSDGEIALLIPVQNRSRLRAVVTYQGPVVAPVVKGQELGKLQVFSGETLIQVTPVVALADVATGSLTDRALSALKELAVGWTRAF